ncbi:cis-2,3-dihydrobiphenyl-2,3-diol dehydrogenase [Mycobacterium xenopi 3993]|nr:cis-2,3-dihydrobiphenyl-2,3-diol dehydrogenase [Mycobacterium xenopi 3993]
MTGWLDGKRALVVGAGSGIGRAVVDAFRAEGAKVAVLERVPDKCHLLRQQLPDVPVVDGDAIDRDANDRAVAAAVDAFGGLDTLVNCVGIFDFYQGICDIDADKLASAFDEMFHTNVLSHLQSVKAAVPALRAGTGPSIVLTESASSFYPGRGGTLYVSSKFAVRGLVTTLAHELAPTIRVNGVAPVAPWALTCAAWPVSDSTPSASMTPPPRPRPRRAHSAQRRAHSRRPCVEFRVLGLRPGPRHHRRNRPS